MTDGQTDGLTDDQREIIIPHHYCVAGYKNVNRINNLQADFNSSHINPGKVLFFSTKMYWNFSYFSIKKTWVLIRSASTRCFYCQSIHNMSVREEIRKLFI